MFGDKRAPLAVVVTQTKIQAQAPPGVQGQSVPVKLKFPTA